MLRVAGGGGIRVAGCWGEVGGTVGGGVVRHAVIVVIVVGISGRDGCGVGWWGIGMNSWSAERAVSAFCRAASGACGGIGGAIAAGEHVREGKLLLRATV